MREMKYLVLLLGAACNAGAAPHYSSPPPSQVENPKDEFALTRVRLSEHAVQRLGIQTALVQTHSVPAERRLGGEVVVPPGRIAPLSAPVAGKVRVITPLVPGSRVTAGAVLLRLTPLAPITRSSQARANREVSTAKTQLESTQARLRRTSALLRKNASSQRALEEATAAQNIARADLEMATTHAREMRSSPLLSDVSLAVRAPEDGVIGSVNVASGQTVAASAPLLEVITTRNLWVRVPVPSMDLHYIDPSAAAQIHPLGNQNDKATLKAKPVVGPSTFTSAAGTVDRYFALPASPPAFAVGEHILVSFPLRDSQTLRSLPSSSILYDSGGSSWAYVCEGDGVYRRALVDIVRHHDELALLSRGPIVGECVVSVGAAELYGSEFKPGH